MSVCHLLKDLLMPAYQGQVSIIIFAHTIKHIFCVKDLQALVQQVR